MKPKVLGISASPQKGGKVETLVQEVLSASRLPHELVRLHELSIGPCRACNGCRADNVCVITDDWGDLGRKILDSSAVVLGGWAFSGMIDAATKALMERFWSFRHHNQLTRGRVGAAVIVGNNPELAGDLADALLQFMRNYGITAMGRVTAAGANPCLGCEDSLSACEYSGVVARYGRLERIGIGMYNPIEHQLGVLKEARILGQRLGHKVEHVMARGLGAEIA
ncbi:MAG: flavodoxin family protein [Deltaproteobacteria bacterium]|nr:flavodoxin family protein [Deltaproteobacteria bacterium]